MLLLRYRRSSSAAVAAAAAAAAASDPTDDSNKDGNGGCHHGINRSMGVKSTNLASYSCSPISCGGCAVDSAHVARVQYPVGNVCGAGGCPSLLASTADLMLIIVTLTDGFLEDEVCHDAYQCRSSCAICPARQRQEETRTPTPSEVIP